MNTKYKTHPIYKRVSVSECGTKVKQYGKLLTIREIYPLPNYPLIVVYLFGNNFSLPKLVLETFVGIPPSRMYAYCIDGNHKNTHPDNLKWVKCPRSLNPKKMFEQSSFQSKLSIEDSYRCYVLIKGGKKTYKQLADEYNTSSSSISRAFKRVERYLNSKNSYEISQ